MTNLGVNPLIRKLRIRITRSYTQIRKHNMIMGTARSVFQDWQQKYIIVAHEYIYIYIYFHGYVMTYYSLLDNHLLKK